MINSLPPKGVLRGESVQDLRQGRQRPNFVGRVPRHDVPVRGSPDQQREGALPLQGLN